MSSNYHINTRQKAEEALRKARKDERGGLANELLPALIVEANGDGWDVATVDEAGNIGRVYERIFSHPVGESFTAGQEVWLWLPSDGENPLILAAGGGGSTCAIGVNTFGVHNG